MPENLDHLEKNRNTSVDLGSKHLTTWQLVKDNCNSETFSIKKLFVSPELQFTQTSGITDSTDNREMSKDLKSDYTGSFSACQQVGQTSEVNNENHRNKPSFQNQGSVTFNSDQTDQENFCPELCLSKISLIPCASALGKPVMHKPRIMTLKDK